jgi:hypothetical protein
LLIQRRQFLVGALPAGEFCAAARAGRYGDRRIVVVVADGILLPGQAVHSAGEFAT